MRLHNLILVGAILMIALTVGAVSAQQGNYASVNGNFNYIDQSNTVHNDQAAYFYSTSSSTSDTQIYNMVGSGVASVSKPNIVMDRILMANQVLVLKINPIGNQTFIVLSGTPIAVYTIEENEQDLVKSSESKMTYDSDYNRMDHGIVRPVDIVPYYTSYTHLTSSTGAAYLVIDNRYYPTDSEIQIGVPGSSEEL